MYAMVFKNTHLMAIKDRPNLSKILSLLEILMTHVTYVQLALQENDVGVVGPGVVRCGSRAMGRARGGRNTDIPRKA